MAKKFSIRYLAVPIFIEMFLRYFSLMVNTYMVQVHNSDLVGAMGSGNLILDLCITIFSFLSVGCSVVVAQALGARKEKLAHKTFHQSLFVNFILGLVFSSVIVFFGEDILVLTNVPKEQFAQSAIYLHMLGICLFFDAISIMLSSLVRVYGFAYFVSCAVLTMNLITITMNYYTLNYTNLDLYGVGLATIIGRITSISILACVVVFKIKIRFSFRDFFSFQKDILKRVLGVGAPSAGEHLVWILHYGIAFSFVNLLGKDSANVQTIYFQISLFIMLIGEALSMANEIIIGKLVGARYLSIAYKHTWRVLWFSVMSTFLVVILAFIFKDSIVENLKLSDILKNIMLPLFSVSIFLETGRTFNIVMVNALRASGDARFPLFTAIIFMFGISLPVGYILCFYYGLGIVGVWIGFASDEWIRGCTNAYRWKSKKWQNKAVV